MKHALRQMQYIFAVIYETLSNAFDNFINIPTQNINMSKKSSVINSLYKVRKDFLDKQYC